MRATTKAPDIAGLKLFDTCMTLGRNVRGATGKPMTADYVLRVMDKHDIAEALVHSSEARLIHPRSRGNRALLEEIADRDRLHPAWVLEPPESPDPSAAVAMVDEMLAAGVKVARLMMGVAPPLHWMWQDLLAALEAHRVPCFLDFAPAGHGDGSTCGFPDAATIDSLRDICLAHPDLQMILSHVSGGLGIAQPVLPLMRRAGNLHIDITSIVDYWRKVSCELGPSRVFFATGTPFYDPAVLVSNVQYAHWIDEPAKRLICGDNLRRLMENVR